MKKRVPAMIAIISFMLLLMLSGCGGSKSQDITLTTGGNGNNDTDSSNTAKKIRIGLVMKTLTNPFFIEMEKGARKAESELGIELIVKTGAKETSIDQQIKIVEDMTEDKVDAIVIAPGSSTDLIPALKKAQDAGIKVVNIDNRLDPATAKGQGLVGVPFISVDNEAAAYLSAKYISDKIKNPLDAVIIEGIRGANNAEMRKSGAMRAFKENKNIKLVASETANWKIDEANTVIKKLYTVHPNIKAIFCANDMMALGVAQYLKDTGRKGVLLAGFDNLEEARTAIKNGEMQVTIDQKPNEQGYIGIKSALDLIQGRSVKQEIMIDVAVVDAASLK